MLHREQEGFSLVELLVVVVVIGILAAIGIPRLLSQRVAARDATALSDLRNLVIIENGLRDGEFSEDPAVLADEGWVVSDAGVTVCAQIVSPLQLVLTAWHVDGSNVYAWEAESPRIVADDSGLPDDCTAAMGPGASQVS